LYVLSPKIYKTIVHYNTEIKFAWGHIWALFSVLRLKI